MIQQLYRLVMDRAGRAQLRSDAKAAANDVAQQFGGTGAEIAKEVAQGARGFAPVESAATRAGRNVRNIFKSTADTIRGFFNETAKGMLAGFATVFAAQRIKDFSTEVVKLGIDAAETSSKFQTTFGDSSTAMDKFLAQWANLAGLSHATGQDMLATAATIAQGMGMSQKSSADFGEQILRLAGDLQSFHNVPIADTFQAIRSGLVGEAEPMRRFGVMLSQAKVETEALRETGKGNVKALTDQELAVARLTIMYREAGPALGDLARTSGSAANQARTLAAWWIDVKTALGEQLLPTVQETISWLNQNKETLVSTATTLAHIVIPVVKLFAGAIWDAGKVVVGTFSLALSGIVGLLSLLVKALAAGSEGAARFWDAIGASDRARGAREAADSMRTFAENAMMFARTAKTVAEDIGGEIGGRNGAFGIMSAFGGGAGAGGTAGAAGPTGPAYKPAPRPGPSTPAIQLSQIQEVTPEVAAAQQKRLGYRAGQLASALGGAADAMNVVKIPAIIDKVEIPDKAKILTPFEQLAQEMGTMLGEDAWQGVVESSWNVADGVYEAFAHAFSLIREEGATAKQVLASVWHGLAAAVMGELKRIAAGKAIQNVASAIEEVAAAAANAAVGNFPGAALHMKAAGGFGLAAAEWGVLAGAAAALGGSPSGGGAGGIGAGGQPVGGTTAERAKPRGPEVHVYLDPISENNPEHQRVIFGAAQNAAERYAGEDGQVFYHSRTGVTA